MSPDLNRGKLATLGAPYATHSGWETLPPPEEATFEMFEQGWGTEFLNRLKQAVETEQSE